MKAAARIMKHWRLVVLAVLGGAPVLVLSGCGIYFLWQSPVGFWVWWGLAFSVALASLIGWRWQQQQHLLRLDFTPPHHWTERDQQAWKLVEERARAAAQLTPDQLTSLDLYQETGQTLAQELARFYHPSAKDPVSALTIPEILAVVELAAHDLTEMVDEYLPGGHLLTVNDLRRIKKVADWYPAANNAAWLISAAFSPLNTAVRYLVGQAGLNRPWQLLQTNVLIWFYSAYVHRLGTYLIDLNSGRLRVGAQRYRELQRTHSPAPQNGAADPAEAVRAVTFTLIGQTKAGKSSLINALLGEQKALTDVLPATASIQRYELQPAGIPTRFALLDTVGYGNAGPTRDQVRATDEAARQSDLVLLVLHAVNPARQADVDMLNQLEAHFAQRPELRRPPILAVVTHIDLLSPSLEWSPPYDWRLPQRPKERNMQQAMAAIEQQFESKLAAVIPVCTAPGKVYGVQEWLLPALVGLLDQAHAVAFLRCLKAETDTGKIRKVFHQLVVAGKDLVKVLWQINRAKEHRE